MARNKKWFTVWRRSDSKTYRFSINPTCGLSERVCAEWDRTSYQNLPAELAHLRNPKNKDAAEAAAQALIQYLKKKQEEEGNARRVSVDDITVGDWIKKFTELDTSPRTGINASKNRPFSIETLHSYKGYYNLHIKDDPICNLKMAEVEEEDILEFITRLSVSKLKDGSGRKMGGTRKFVLVLSFVRTAFNSFQRRNKQQTNPFQYIEKPSYYKTKRGALTKDEMVKLFMPGVLLDTMELAVCAAIFLSGLRRAEVSALRPEDLDWKTPKITVCRSWQLFNNRNKILGTTKGKKERDAPFDPVLQAAIKKLWNEHGENEFVFSYVKNNKVNIIGSSWIKGRFPKWLKRAGIELGGRKIVPHSSRHSLASLLETKGVSLRYIQDLLGHSDLKTTLGYLHSPEQLIRDIGNTITEEMNKQPEKQKPEEKKIFEFKVS